MILSLPNLKELSVRSLGVTTRGPLPTYSVTSLNSLELRPNVDGIGEGLAKSRFMSSHLSLAVHIPGVEQLLMLSSEAVV